MEQPGLRLGILIGGLAAAVLGLGALVVVLLVSDDGDDTSPPVAQTGTATMTDTDEPCEIIAAGGTAKIDFLSGT